MKSRIVKHLEAYRDHLEKSAELLRRMGGGFDKKLWDEYTAETKKAQEHFDAANELYTKANA